MRKNGIAWSMMGLALGIGAGALGAHALEGVLSPRYLSVWETAWKYWMYNMLGIMALLAFVERIKEGDALSKVFYKPWGVVRWIGIGAILFTGTLVLVSLNEVIGSGFRILGAVTPIGGLILIGAWFWGGFRLIQHRNS